MMKISHGLPSEQSSVSGSASNLELEDELTWVDIYSWHLIWGIHLSPNRGAGKAQPLEASCKMCRMFGEVISNQVYQGFQRMDKELRYAVTRVNNLCKCCTSGSEVSRVCKG
jgi:thiamine biosynthesis lipoprotein ApbE